MQRSPQDGWAFMWLTEGIMTANRGSVGLSGWNYAVTCLLAVMLSFNLAKLCSLQGTNSAWLHYEDECCAAISQTERSLKVTMVEVVFTMQPKQKYSNDF